jgi:hypothetical protein
MAGSPNQCPRHPNARLPQAIGGWQLRLICTANAQRAAQTSNSSILVNAGSGWRYISAKTIRAMIYRHEVIQRRLPSREHRPRVAAGANWGLMEAAAE